MSNTSKGLLRKTVDSMKLEIKNYIPSFLMPVLREASYRLMRASDDISAQKEILNLRSQWKHVIDNSAETIATVKNGNNKHILFMTGFGLGTAYLTIEPLLMMGLFVRGCKITSLVCDKELPACEFNATGNNNPSAGCMSCGITKTATLYRCRMCSDDVVNMYSALPLDLRKYKEFIDENDLLQAKQTAGRVSFKDFRNFEYSGIRIGEEAFASVLRITLMGTIKDTRENRGLVYRFLVSGIMMTKIAERAFASIKPDRIVMPHGVYITHGIASKVAAKLNIPSVIYGGAYRKNTVMLSHKESYHRTMVHEPNSVWEHLELSPENRQALWTYLLSKQGGGCDYVSYHPNPIEDLNVLYKTLHINGSREIVSLFTNVIWDAQIYYDFNVFENIFEWVFTTIDELAKNDKVWLVIRIHPAEIKGGLPTRQPFLDEIMKKYPVLPDNVRVIPPESDLSSYTLAENSRAAIIYGTKMGLEIVTRGIPLIVCGETFNRNKGFSIDISDRQQYLDLLRNITSVPKLDVSVIERALKYAYYYFFQKMIYLKQLKYNDPRSAKNKKVEFQKLSDLLPGKDKNLDVICDGILELKPFCLEN